MRTTVTLTAVLISVLSVIACGPSDKSGGPGAGGGDGGGGQIPEGYGPNSGTVSGVVWAPANAPGMVPAGHELPISGALVWVSVERPTSIPAGVYCDACQATSGYSTRSDAKGAFTLSAPTGHWWLTIQKGQFRIEQEIDLQEEIGTPLTATQTMLPMEHDPARGLWRPRIALVDGSYDQLEGVLGKLGLGTVDDFGEFMGSSAAGNFDLYANDGEHYSYASSDVWALVSDVAAMAQYHIIFIPCAGGDVERLFDEPRIRDNIREYVSMGGKFYVTDWSAEWADAVFPEFVEFEAAVDTTNPAGPFGDGDGFNAYESYAAQASDPALHAWLEGQQGPIYEAIDDGYGGYLDLSSGVVDADAFAVEGNWDRIVALHDKQTTDATGGTVTSTPKTWVSGDWGGGAPTHPLTVTYEPGGCGRVLYSTYHTAAVAHEGLLPQERVLVYLIMEIGECAGPPID